ncbi:MAG: hypothetical protein EOP04_20740 [Proteobacteria bacterium]|nr:MAG: hypothetical protein EOP04_20740 [Pseudomonadota bacterium]
MWRWKILPYIGELVLFLLTAGGLGYTAQTVQWTAFGVILLVAASLFLLLKWLEHGPVLENFAKLEQERNRFLTDFEEWGIKDIFNMRHQEEMTRRNAANQRLIESGRSFSLVAETAASYIDPAIRRHWDPLKLKLEAGCPLRLLILDPFCESKAFRNEHNGVTSPIDPKLRLDILFDLPKNFPKVEVRFTREPYCSAFITDKGLIYDPYHAGNHAGRIENYFFAIEIAKSGDEKAYWLMSSHFENLWTSAQTLESWRREHRKRY